MHKKNSSIRNKIELLGVCLLLSYCPVGLAATEAQTTEKLNQLVKAQQYAEAFALANQHMMDYGGEPAFDYLTGIAALKINEYQQAVFAFERAVIVKPKWKLARFNLAQGYYHIDNLVAAKKELELLLVDAQDGAFKTAIEQFLTRVNQSMLGKKRQFKQVLGMSIGYDSNVNSGTTIDEINSPLLSQPIQLSEDGKETSDGAFNINYQLRYQSPITQKRLLIGEFALFHTDYFESQSQQFQSSVAQFSGKLQDQWGDSTYQIGAYLRPLLLDGSLYRTQYGIESNIITPLNKRWSIGVQLGVGKTDYEEIKTLESLDSYMALSAQYSTPHWRHQLSANYTDINAEKSDSEYNSYSYYLLQYQNSYIISSAQQVTFSLQYQDYDYDDIHPFWLKIRDEDMLRATVGWRYVMKDWLVWQLNYKRTEKDSNVSIYEYERDEVSLGVVMQF
ncbi:MAG: hypothetical protein ACI9FJ_001141 [Alteromonadaceae bacterium]|jgi:hypothetical protein